MIQEDMEGKRMEPSSEYPARLEISYPDRELNRVSTFFRLDQVMVNETLPTSSSSQAALQAFVKLS